MTFNAPSNGHLGNIKLSTGKVTKAACGEDVILLIDSLSRFAEEFGDPDSARELFDAGLSSGQTGRGSLTVVAALERSR